MKYIFFADGTGDGPSDAIVPKTQNMTVSMTGTWDGATVTLEGSLANEPWVELDFEDGTIAAFTADKADAQMSFPQEMRLRAVISNAGGSTSLSVIGAG